MTYTIYIYRYEGCLIFTGERDLYFEKYRGIGPGIYSQPIVCLPQGCQTAEMQEALSLCVRTLEQNREKIAEENAAYSITQMEDQLFRNFKSLGIKATRRQVIRSSVMVMVRMNQSPVLCRCVPEGHHMKIQKEIPLPRDIRLIEIARLIGDLLEP